MKRIISLLGLLVVMAVSCVEEQHIDVQVLTDDPVFYATMEDSDVAATRAYVNDQLRIRWDEGDHISIFNKNTSNREYAFQGQTGDNSGEFRKVPSESFFAGNPLDYVYAVYPYSESTGISDDGEITLTLPAEQSYRENSFGPGANTMIAVADDNDLMFKNLCGYLMLKLYGDGVSVSSITLRGNKNEPMAGKATVNASVDGDPSLSFDSSATNEITLTFDTPVALGTTAETTTTFWLVIPPTVFEAGITLTVETSDGGVFEKRTTGSLVLSRNTRSTMAALKVIPEPSVRYLTFTSEGTTTLSLTNFVGNAPVLYYSTDRANWTLWDYSELTFTSEQPLYLCGDNPEGFSAETENRVRYSTFISNGSNFQVSGDIMSLIDKNEVVRAIPSAYCFRRLFNECRGLTKAPELPATTLAGHCYTEMFVECSSLTTAPELPATTLDNDCYMNMFMGCISLTIPPVLPALKLMHSCYQNMFAYCTSLTTAPELPATTLAYSCYSGMFDNCTSLTTAPELPATTMTEWCYDSMFRNCTSLSAAPELPATTLAFFCYGGMFQGCTSLAAAPKLPATTLAEHCYSSMFGECTSLTTAPDLPATTLAESCYRRMFYGCSQLNYVKCLATDISASDCVSEWLSNVASTGTFVKAPGVNWPTGTSGIPEGWSVINDEGGPFYPEAVDLGLPSGIKWASFNLGATSPEEYGEYYAWGETEPYYSSLDPLTWKDGKEAGYDWPSYKWCMGSATTITKYCTDSSHGTVDNNTELQRQEIEGETMDDAAKEILGGKWRMPGKADFEELINNTDNVWTTYNGVNGWMFSCKTNSANWIFLPAAGHWDNTNFNSGGTLGHYWSKSLYTDNSAGASALYFKSSDGINVRNFFRRSGKVIRPVYAEHAPLPSGSGTEADPYLIRVPSDLQGMATKAAPNSTTYFKLVDNIDMTGITEYTPVNVNFSTDKQSVVIDGNHKVISNWNWVNTTSKYPGLVGILDGVIKDLVFVDCNIETKVGSTVGLACGWCGVSNASLHGRLENVHAVRCSVVTSVDGSNNMGGLVGSAHNTEIINCSFDGRVERTVCTKTSYIGTGGLVGGYPSADATGEVNILENCWTSGSVIDISRSCGGVVGFMKADCKVNFKNIHSTADVHSTKDMVGGIVGYYGGGVFTECWYKGNIVSEQTGSSFVGGIVPHNNWGLELYRCHTQGTITCPGDVVGGLVGQCNAANNENSGPCIMKECWSTMMLNGRGTVGGIIGRSSRNWPMTVENCWFSGGIHATGNPAGGIVGDAPKKSTVKDCWTDVDITGSFGLGGVAGKMCGRLDNNGEYLDIDAASTMTGCIYWGRDIKTTTEGGETCTSNWSSGAVVGCSCFTNTFKDNYRNPAMTFEVYRYAPLNVLFDHEDTDPTHPLVEPYNYVDTPFVLFDEDGDTEDFKWFAPYHGKAAAAGSTVSSLAKNIGWDESIWDLSADYPMLKNNPVPVSTE